MEIKEILCSNSGGTIKYNSNNKNEANKLFHRYNYVLELREYIEAKQHYTIMQRFSSRILALNFFIIYI